ncbi:MAG TPA: hypothetical protein VHG69_03995 [Thermoleophilaceae bacterium]|nr:hypothetical protein [Thermoleophilaceae bacterium]
MLAPDPTHAAAGRRELFRAYLRGRAAVYGYLLGCGGAFLVGAWQQSPLIMAAGPAAVALGVAGIAWYAADRAAAGNFYRKLSQSLGLFLVGRAELLPLTPLLGAGDRRHCENWMQGTLPGDPPLRGGFGHFVYEEIPKKRGDDAELVQLSESHRLALCLAELEPSIALFKGVFMRPRPGLFDFGEDWQRRNHLRTLQLESAAFTDRYQLRITDDQDERRARELFSPTLVNFLATHPLAPCFELKAGTLAVFVPRVLEDEGNLVFLLDAARHIAGRVLREVEEAAARPAA